MQEYHDLLKHILHWGDGHNDRTGVGTQSAFGCMSEYDMSEGFPLMTTKRLSFRWIAEELFWFLSGSTNVNHLRARCKRPIKLWDAWATEEQCARFRRPRGELGPIYGHEWRNSQATQSNETGWYCNVTRRWISWGFLDDGIDQIRRLMDMLMDKKARLSRRLIVSGWNARECDSVALPPCHTLFHFKYHEESNTLDLLLYQRSCDVFLGVPYNIASYALLLRLVAHCCNMHAGVFKHVYGDVHIYSNHRGQVFEQLNRTIRKKPLLSIDPSLAGKGFDGLMDCEWSHLRLVDYDPHPEIKADVAV